MHVHCAPIVLHIHKKFELNRIKIKGGCQSNTKAAVRESWSNLTLNNFIIYFKSDMYFILVNMKREK